MPLAPSAATKYFNTVNATITLSGSDTYVGVKNLRMQWGYAMLEEDRIGNNDPVQAAGAFRGTIEFEVLGYSESVHHDWLTPSSGQITTRTLSIAETDEGATTRTWTVLAKINSYEEVMREVNFVRYRFSGVLTDEPTEST